METVTGSIDAFNTLKDSVGLAIALLLVSNAIALWLFISERRDRRAAWHAHNESLVRTHDAILKFTETVTVLTEVVRAGGRGG